LSKQLQAHLGLILAMIIWGSSFVALKVSIQEIPGMQVIFYRLLIALIFFAILWPLVRPSFQYQAGDWKYLLALSLFEPCLYFIFETLALEYTSAAQAGMITSMLPIMIAVSALIFLGERSNTKQWFGLGLAVFGVMLMSVFSEDNAHATNAPLGNFLEFLAMCTAAGYTLITKKLVARYSAFVITAIQCLIGTLFFLPLALSSPDVGELSLESILCVFYLGIIVSIGAYGLYNYSLGFVNATVAGAYINLIPISALLIAWLYLDEALNFVQYSAIALIFVGVYLSRELPSSNRALASTD